MVFALATVSGAAEYYTDVYLKGGASGSGASASDPVGTWQDAYEALDLTKDCTIVICGPTTMTKMYNYGKPYGGSVTITNKFDGVDYRETAGACLNIGASGHFVCNGSTAAENSVYTTVSGLTVGAQYKVSAYINATTKTTAHLFAREVGAKNYPFVSVSAPSRYVLRTFVFTATAPTMEIGLSVPTGTSEFKYACLDDFVVVRAEEKVAAATVKVTGNASANKYTGVVNVNIKGGAKASTGNDVYLKVEFANTAATTLDVPMTWSGETYATIPFYKTGADVYANASDATYIPIVLGENTVVSLDVGTTGLYIYSAEIVTVKDRW